MLGAAMVHSTHDVPAAGQPHEHPSLPPVHDEAADTPLWIPVVGLALLAIVALIVVGRATEHGDTSALRPATQEASVADQAEASAPSAK
jgi:hypothetical protein